MDDDGSVDGKQAPCEPLTALRVDGFLGGRTGRLANHQFRQDAQHARGRSLATNPRVQERKRQEKREIANWFQVWLETPDLFADWLALRKSSEGFRTVFGASAPTGDSPRIAPSVE